MDAGQITRYLQSRTQNIYFNDINKRGQQSQLNINEGAIALVRNGITLVQAPVPVSNPIGQSAPAPVPPQPNCNIIDTTLALFEDFLKWIGKNNLSPTQTARALYIWFMAVTTAWNWIQGSSTNLTGSHDEWNWDTHYPISSATMEDNYVWYNHIVSGTLQSAFSVASNFMVSPPNPPAFTPYDTSGALAEERAMLGWTAEQQIEYATIVLPKGNASAYLSAWNTWITYRANDGSNASSQTQPSALHAVNINNYIPTYLPTNILQVPNKNPPPSTSALPDSHDWTPLKVSGAANPQKYLTYFWDRVFSTGITSEQELALDAVGAPFYADSSNNRVSELMDIINRTANLTDTKRCAAEFWAGGPNTVTPPGIFAWFWKEYITLKRPSQNTTLFSGLDLAIHLFESARITWREKSKYMQARPIQEIRARFANQRFGSWNNIPNHTASGNNVPPPEVSGNFWLPYQETTFVTPPFADFPSGHSCFSQSFVLVMSEWYGPTIPSDTINITDMNLVSPMYNATPSQSSSLGHLVVKKGSSRILPGVVPTNDTVNAWTTWQDMANSAGLSRLYGGIHCITAHQGSQAIATALHPMLKALWNIKSHP